MSASQASAAIDFRFIEGTPLRYDLACSEHGPLGAGMLGDAAGALALAHDRTLHNYEADWRFAGESIVESFAPVDAEQAQASLL